MSSAFSPMSDGPSATTTARPTHGTRARGADVVQAVEGVAHQHDAEAAKTSIATPATTSAAAHGVAHRHSSRKASTNRRYAIAPTNDTTASTSARSPNG